MPPGATDEDIEKEISRHYKTDYVAKVKVYGEEKPMETLVEAPLNAPDYSDGRGTRGFWAAAKGTADEKWRCYFLKDTWRTVASSLPTEGENHSKLGKSSYIPTLRAHGDVYADDTNLERDGVWPEELECSQ